MKYLLITIWFLIVCNFSVAQSNSNGIKTEIFEGGSVTTINLRNQFTINKGSSLGRTFYNINLKDCPIELTEAGINTQWIDDFTLAAGGKIFPLLPVSAYEIHFVLFDVFRRPIRILATSYVRDIKDIQDFPSGTAYWFGSKVDLQNYFTSIAYVAHVRDSQGVLWKFSKDLIKSEVSKLGFQYPENEIPALVGEFIKPK
jgi:hypothetical protein